MARKIDKKSTRQKVFTYLDKVDEDVSRQSAVERVIKKFNIGKVYAMTLYQSHRKQNKEAGVLVEVFRVRDYKDGRPVTPFMSSTFEPRFEPTNSTTKSAAITKYVKRMNTLIKEAKKL